jgi:hypothetical protein
MIRWLKRLIAGPELRELDEIALRRAVKEGWVEAMVIASLTTGEPPYDIAKRVPSPDRVLTDWDVALAVEQPEPEPGRIEYRFLGVTGEEDA